MNSEGSETGPNPEKPNLRVGGDDAANFFEAGHGGRGAGFPYRGFRDSHSDDASDEDKDLVPIVLPEPVVTPPHTGKVTARWHSKPEPEPEPLLEPLLDTAPVPVPVPDPKPLPDSKPLLDPVPVLDPEPKPLLDPVPVAVVYPEHEAARDPEPVQPIVLPEPETSAAAPPQPELLSTIPAPPVWPEKPAKSRSRKPVTLALAFALVAVLLAFGGGYLLGVNQGPTLTDGLGVQHLADSAPQVVQTYLEALSQGDADLARKIAGASSTEVLLSKEVLQRSNEMAAITKISVGKAAVDGDEVTVPAKFTVGDTTVDRTFSLRNTSGGWQLYDGLVGVSLPSLTGFSAKLNGTALDSVETRVFPGTYSVELGDADFELNNGTAADGILVGTPEQAAKLRDLQPRLNSAATKRYIKMVRSSLDECLSQKSLTTPCGLDVSAKLKDGSTPVDGTVERSLDSEGNAALDALVVQLDAESPGTVFSVPNIQVKTRLEAENSGSRVSGELLYGGQLLSPHVDFSADSPAVVWK